MDDVHRLIKDEATEDLYRLPAVERRTRLPGGRIARKRMPWLIVNLATGFLAAAVSACFEHIDGWAASPFSCHRRGLGERGNTDLTVIIRALAGS